jgi:transposase/ssDNA-binding Zn-finger/Zn-ribbon topoisomerase 1
LLLPEVIDDYVDPDNPVRFLDAYVDNLNLLELGFQTAIPKETGRPPYDPRDLLKLYLYGYLNNIRSSRQLEKATHRNLELIWLMRKLRPDFKTIADFRKDNPAALKQVCRDFSLLCKRLDLFGSELVAIDSGKFKAVNNKNRNFTKKTLRYLLKKIDLQINEYIQNLDQEDQAESKLKEPDAKELKSKISQLRAQKSQMKKIQRRLEQSDETQISMTDPDSRRMHTPNGLDICYNVQFVSDDKHKLIVEHKVTNQASDYDQLADLAVQAKEVLDAETLDVVADMGYYDSHEIKKCAEDNLNCYIPKPIKSNNKNLGLFTKEDFRYDAEKDCYICPANQQLTYRFQAMKSGRQTKIYETSACPNCALKPQCTRSKRRNRRIYRWVDEAILEEMQQRVAQNPNKFHKRKQLIEHPIGTIKHWMNQGHFLSRGLEKVSGEMALTVLAYNLKRVINIVGVKELIYAVS